MSEFFPHIEGLADAHKLGAWLADKPVTLDASSTNGFLATTLVVEHYDQHGKWLLPLMGGIDIVNVTDLHFATTDPLYTFTRVTGMTDDNPATVEASYHAIDDEVRRASIDPAGQAIFVPLS